MSNSICTGTYYTPQSSWHLPTTSYRYFPCPQNTAQNTDGISIETTPLKKKSTPRIAENLNPNNPVISKEELRIRRQREEEFQELVKQRERMLKSNKFGDIGEYLLESGAITLVLLELLQRM